ncbi:heme ABC transporter ATP-binding protein [Albibacterium bauzanense]|uniref:Iron complex transport system ATP-binding protein n=1 Tax=Albibacterium bauzanense TaxID=653929 RepID=A0A4R1M1L0_9SPHI|nr:heme ABC transporter ATP-binding protein [Albibacterium bauzanense]TCK85866.1 iron complex transport system ATP-binding protein [Albibacterium bauzanense]
MIEIKNLSYSVGKKRLLSNVGFDVQPGELLAIIGANGAGKSTLLKLLCKEIPSESGEILIRDKPIEEYKLDALAKFRAVLAQNNTISVSFRVHELVMMGRYPHFDSQPSEYDIQIVKNVMEETGITSFMNRDYNTLSGGEQQRVQLARVIAQIYDQPGGLLFLDEPTNGLDLLYQQQIMQLARELADRGYCVISILHDINFASRFADKVLILKKGELVAFGKPKDVISCENIHRAFNIRVRLFTDDEFKCPLIVPSMILTEQNNKR